MKRIAPIRLEYDPKTLWFDPGEIEVAKGDSVVVETARGIEFGVAASGIVEVEDERVDELKTPLKPILRVATEEDFAQRDEMRRLSVEALPVFRELAAETNEQMRPIMVEYLFDGTKAIFLFESEERADFRELVRKLTNRLHVRVDMRQIGVRDEARIVGGLGHCGQELCCRRLGGEFNPVSIRMAKAQDLSLNPAQISGVCGRLMCCLRYEYDTYKDFKARAPKLGGTVHTPEGDFKVAELDMPHEVVVLRVDKNKKVRIPLSAFDPVEEGAESQRPKSVGDVYYEYANANDLAARLAASMGTTERFTGEDKLAEKGMVRHNPQRQKEEAPEQPEEEAPASRRKRRSRGSRPAGQQREAVKEAPRSRAQRAAAEAEKAHDAAEPRKRRRRRGAAAHAEGAPAPRQASAAASRKRKTAEAPDAAAKPATGNGTAHRRVRRRSHKAGGASTDEQV
ncbi:MAG: regulatory iron-sulfur-containing complex subunit RicT [Coriobacteriia bacterium]|nr:regulatory iron-sulfur-containing complex subunit RicT [Coriobacteriia bacterium]